jgi:hypothetical protein
MRRASHVSLRELETPEGRQQVLIDDAESPLGWLAKRCGRDGHPLITAAQFVSGERLRADFTRAQMMPRTTSNWSAAGAPGVRGAPPMHHSDMVVAARERVTAALAAAGPEFSGILLDVCCFLKGLSDVERDRRWPARSAKIVLQLGLDRLARHYGYTAEIRGPAHAATRAWNDGVASRVDGVQDEGTEC